MAADSVVTAGDARVFSCPVPVLRPAVVWSVIALRCGEEKSKVKKK